MSFLYGLLLPIRACTLEITDILVSRRHIGQNHIKMMTQPTVESTPKRILYFSPYLCICQPLWCILLSNLLKLYILDLINQKKYIYTPKHHADPLSVSSASFLFPLSPPPFLSLSRALSPSSRSFSPPRPPTLSFSQSTPPTRPLPS